MAKKSSKGKSPKGKTKKKSKKRVSWWKKFFVLTILCAGIFYFFPKYGVLNVLKGKFEQFLPKRDMEVNLYFVDPDSEYLSAERRTLSKPFTQKQRITQTVKELISGPRGNLIRTTPTQTILNNVLIDNNKVVWLDFSAHLSKDHPGGSSAEITTVYSIVNTILLNYKEITKVRILIDGNAIETLAGHIDCSRALVADRGLIK